MRPFVLSAPLTGLASGARVELDDDVRHHVHTVLRLRDGDEVEAADGNGRVAAAVLDGDGLVLTDDVYVELPREPGLTVLQALGKGRKHDEVVRVLTECGVERIVAVSAEQSVTVLRDDKVDRVRARWEAVARSAVQQSRNAWAPEVLGPVGITRAVEELPEDTLLLVADTTEAVAAVTDVDVTFAPHVAVAIGPESGWTDDERNLWRAHDAEFVGLGPTVLRTEHAAVVAVSAIGAMAGRLDG